MTQPWFHSGLTRDETHALFAKQGMVDGMFLIRESQRIPGAFVLSFSHNQKVKHYQINMVSQSRSRDTFLWQQFYFWKALRKLVEKFRGLSKQADMKIVTNN